MIKLQKCALGKWEFDLRPILINYAEVLLPSQTAYSGETVPLIPEQTGHPSERSDAGVFVLS